MRQLVEVDDVEIGEIPRSDHTAIGHAVHQSCVLGHLVNDELERHVWTFDAVAGHIGQHVSRNSTSAPVQDASVDHHDGAGLGVDVDRWPEFANRFASTGRIGEDTVAAWDEQRAAVAFVDFGESTYASSDRSWFARRGRSA